MVVVSMLPHAEIGRNDHREDAPQFTLTGLVGSIDSILNKTHWAGYIPASVQRLYQPFANPSILLL